MMKGEHKQDQNKDFEERCEEGNRKLNQYQEGRAEGMKKKKERKKRMEENLSQVHNTTIHQLPL